MRNWRKLIFRKFLFVSTLTIFLTIGTKIEGSFSILGSRIFSRYWEAMKKFLIIFDSKISIGDYKYYIHIWGESKKLPTRDLGEIFYFQIIRQKIFEFEWIGSCLSSICTLIRFLGSIMVRNSGKSKVIFSPASVVHRNVSTARRKYKLSFAYVRTEKENKLVWTRTWIANMFDQWKTRIFCKYLVKGSISLFVQCFLLVALYWFLRQSALFVRIGSFWKYWICMNEFFACGK